MRFGLTQIPTLRLLHLVTVLVGVCVFTSNLHAQSCGHYVRTKFDKPHSSQIEIEWERDRVVIAQHSTPATPGCRSSHPVPESGVLAPVKLAKDPTFYCWLSPVMAPESKPDFPEGTFTFAEMQLAQRLFRPPKVRMS